MSSRQITNDKVTVLAEAAAATVEFTTIDGEIVGEMSKVKEVLREHL